MSGYVTCQGSSAQHRLTKPQRSTATCQTVLGRELREHYEPPHDLPHQILTPLNDEGGAPPATSINAPFSDAVGARVEPKCRARRAMSTTTALRARR
jgi:hypothetical protein